MILPVFDRFGFFRVSSGLGFLVWVKCRGLREVIVHLILVLSRSGRNDMVTLSFNKMKLVIANGPMFVRPIVVISRRSDGEDRNGQQTRDVEQHCLFPALKHPAISLLSLFLFSNQSQPECEKPQNATKAMAKSGGRPSSASFITQRSGSGTILRIKLENFMCHSNLQIEFGEWVNFITGQNGSKCFAKVLIFSSLNRSNYLIESWVSSEF